MKIFPLLAMLSIVTTIHSRVACSDARPSPVSTDMESFVASATVILNVAKDVGSLRSTDASVAVAAVIANDTSRPGERMRGLRFVMENNTGSAGLTLAVYGGRGFEFPGHRPTELAALIRPAIARLDEP